jgi:membrane-associated phospholipid phosphatase
MLTEVLFVTAVPTNIIKWSNIFMGIDRAIFSVYPAFFMYEHYNFIFERIVVESYNYLTIFLSLWTLFLITTNRMEEFVRWSRDFLLALAISIPLWMVFPATQPSIMYVANIFRQPIPTELAKAIDVGPPSEYINMWSLKYSEMWIDQTGKRFSTSNFPSMHVIWGLLLLLSISRVFKSRIITSVFSLYALTNIIGTVYVLQHYAVDALVGILVVVLVISVNRDNN